VIYNLGPKAMRIYEVLRGEIVGGQMPIGAKLPSHVELASKYGVAPLTVRQVLARLEDEHLVSRQQGRGTFVTGREAPAVLLAVGGQEMCEKLHTCLSNAGHSAILVSRRTQALAVLNERNSSIRLIFSELNTLSKAGDLDFIRTVRRSWPAMALAVVADYPGDLSELAGTPDCPVLMLTKPILHQQVQQILSLALSS
jgi:DNA-binding transcriptional regulator YhcF (GntR family)